MHLVFLAAGVRRRSLITDTGGGFSSRAGRYWWFSILWVGATARRLHGAPGMLMWIQVDGEAQLTAETWHCLPGRAAQSCSRALGAQHLLWLWLGWGIPGREGAGRDVGQQLQPSAACALSSGERSHLATKGMLSDFSLSKCFRFSRKLTQPKSNKTLWVIKNKPTRSHWRLF